LRNVKALTLGSDFRLAHAIRIPSYRNLRSHWLLTLCTGCKLCRRTESYVNVRFGSGRNGLSRLLGPGLLRVGAGFEQGHGLAGDR
jgi:hypothetical protein